MPSLKLPVIWELISRTRRLSTVSLLWKKAAIRVMTGVSATTHSARRQLMTNMTTITPTRYERFHTVSIRPQATMEPMRLVSDMTRAWM